MMKETGRLRGGQTGSTNVSPPASPSARLPVPPEEEPPPLGGSWRVLYAVVLLWLAAQVVLFYLFTEAFR